MITIRGGKKIYIYLKNYHYYQVEEKCRTRRGNMEEERKGKERNEKEEKDRLQKVELVLIFIDEKENETYYHPQTGKDMKCTCRPKLHLSASLLITDSSES